MSGSVRPVKSPEVGKQPGAQARWSTRVAVGARIRNARLSARLSLSGLAERLTTPAYLARIEAGERWPSRDLAAGLARALQVSPDELGRGMPSGFPGLQFELTHADLLHGSGKHRDAVQVSTDLADVARCLGADQVADAADVVRARALVALGDTRSARGLLRSGIAGTASAPGLVASAKLFLLEGRHGEAAAVGRYVASSLPSGSRLSGPEVADLALSLCEAYEAMGREGTAAHVARVALRHLSVEGALVGTSDEGLQSVVARALSYRSFEHVARSAEGDVAAMHAARLGEDAARLRRFASAERRVTGTLDGRMAM